MELRTLLAQSGAAGRDGERERERERVEREGLRKVPSLVARVDSMYRELGILCTYACLIPGYIRALPYTLRSNLVLRRHVHTITTTCFKLPRCS